MKSFIYFLLIFLTMSSPVTAQLNQLLPNETSDRSSNQQPKVELDSLGRNTPRGTVEGLFKSLSNHDYERATEYIEWPDSAKALGDSAQVLLIRKMEITLNKKGRMFPKRLISDKAKGDENDNLEPLIDEVGSLEFDRLKSPILLKAKKVEDDENLWLLSARTTQELIDHIEDNKETYTDEITKTGPLSDAKTSTIVEWLAMIGVSIASFFLAWLLTRLVKLMVLRIWKNYRQSAYGKFLDAILIPSRLVITVVILLAISRLLEISIAARQAFGVINLIAMWFALFVFLWLLINALSSIGEEQLKDNNKFGGLSIISFFQNVAKFSLVIIAI